MKNRIMKFSSILVSALVVFGLVACAQPSGGDTKATVATPTFNIAAGDVDKGTTVQISCTTDEAVIYYTTDDTDPTTESSTYSSAITINSATTIKAIAVKEGMNNSVVASAVYTIYVPKYSVGDFVLKTGIRKSKDESPSADSVAAVIIRADKVSEPALGVGLVQNTGLAWFPYTLVNEITNISSLNNPTTGKDSWEKVKEATGLSDSDANKYPAFEFCLKYGSEKSLIGDLASGWFLPTTSEIADIYNNRSVINESLQKASGNTFSDKEYWTCCQNPNMYYDAYRIQFSLSYFKPYSNDKKENKYVCALHQFN